MKKDFVQLIKDMRLALMDEFQAIVTSDLSVEQKGQKLLELEEKQDKMIAEAGYDPSEYYKHLTDYYMDFRSSNPDEWVIKYDPENAQIVGRT